MAVAGENCWKDQWLPPSPEEPKTEMPRSPSICRPCTQPHPHKTRTVSAERSEVRARAVSYQMPALCLCLCLCL